ncbi:alpha/beta hydrolase [Pseudomonas putida]|uniref:alpha/beta hydrolase n=1 Tax=Pseudomonas putida TaxID=303 RepID=UPI000CB2E00B|nr:alpha/beta hydrolase [Pseudomonas putida]PNG83495.1 hypothetical protein CBL13_03328 [Pseudomonas putida]
MKELKFNYKDLSVKYKFKPRKHDTRHLIVVFSGFGAVSEFTYDFENALQDCPANVLWIKDDFGDHCTYYILKNNDFGPEHAVQALISHTLQLLNLDKTQCTLAGFSKGGSAALYHGLKYNFKNIVSTVPQMNIASYVINNWPQTASNMFGTQNNDSALSFDEKLPNILKTDTKLNKNIYLLTSESDIQFPTEIKPFKGEFLKYDNFNFFLSRSVLVRVHNQVTSHHSSLLISIFYSLANNIAPKYGYCELYGDRADESKKTDIGKPIIELKNIYIKNSRLFLEGVGILKHVPSDNWKDVKFQLFLTNSESLTTLRVDLAKDNRPSLTRQYYSESFTSYDKSWFCTLKHEGIDLNTIPPGKYQCYLRIIMAGHDCKVPLYTQTKSAFTDNRTSSQIQCSTDGVYLQMEKVPSDIQERVVS